MENHPSGIGSTHGPPTTLDSLANTGQSLETPVLDYERYRSDLADFGLTREQEEAYLDALWTLVQAVVDASFGLDSAQLLLGSVIENAGLTESDALAKKDLNTNQGGNHD